jgi:hypothetical protein
MGEGESMTDENEINDKALAVLEDIDRDITKVDASAMAILHRSDVEMQIDAAHRYPRSIGRFLKEATALATLTPEIAGMCMYALPRGGKSITGPSVRLAEICASAYGNMHVGSRVLEAADKQITAQGIAWDLEKNLCVTIEAQRRITKSNGQRYDDDMIGVTGMAAGSIALRNAIFRVVPRAYVESVLAAARRVAVGDAKTLPVRRDQAIGHFAKLGITKEQVLSKLEKPTVEDIGLDDLEVLIGIATALKDNAARIDEYFPAQRASTGPAATSTGTSLEEKLRASKPAAKAEPKAEEKPAGKVAPHEHMGEATDGPPPEDELRGRE